MMYRTCSLLTIALLIAAAHAQTGPDPGADAPPPSLAEADLDVQRLSAWGERRYDLVGKTPGADAVAGTLTLETEVADDKVVLRDDWALTVGDERIVWNIKTFCRPDGTLSPRLVFSKGEGSDEITPYTLSVRDGEAAISVDGRMQTLDLPEHTVTDMALLRLMALLPREQGKAWRLAAVLELAELNLKPAASIRCVGTESQSISGEALDLWKYELVRDDRVITEVWVDGPGQLRMARLNNGLLLLEQQSPGR